MKAYKPRKGHVVYFLMQNYWKGNGRQRVIGFSSDREKMEMARDRWIDNGYEVATFTIWPVGSETQEYDRLVKAYFKR